MIPTGSFPSVAITPSDYEEAPDLFAGRHAWVWRGHYSHHAILDGEGGVIHYDKSDPPVVTRDSFEDFLFGADRAYLVPESLPAEKVLEAAENKLGAGGYHLATYNCESFSNECARGYAWSWQVALAATISVVVPASLLTFALAR